MAVGKGDRMGLDLWFQADVIRILAALSSAGSERHPAYHEALRDVGLAFGLREADHCDEGRGPVNQTDPQRVEQSSYPRKRQLHAHPLYLIGEEEARR